MLAGTLKKIFHFTAQRIIEMKTSKAKKVSENMSPFSLTREHKQINKQYTITEILQTCY